ncbi:MAG: DUF11 domain-containing protein [Chloroflexi bacterium]|nr:DUF11 domain-containing protein [Chloroflexota bacterium]
MHRTILLHILLLLLVASLALPLQGGAALSTEPSDSDQNNASSSVALPGQAAPQAPVSGSPPPPRTRDDDPGARGAWFYLFRTTGDPGVGFTLADAASARAQAAETIIRMKEQQQRDMVPSAFGSDWEPIGPDPLVQMDNSNTVYRAVSGRISALAIRSSAPYTMYVGAAQGGIWISSTLTSNWIPKTDQLPSLAIGAIALAPSNEDVVYVGTGEGSLSGDSYYGNGILKSTDGGNTFAQVSGSFFNQVSIGKIAVDPTNPNHLYVAALSGVAGSRYARPPNPTPFGIWESTDGGVAWRSRTNGLPPNNDRWKAPTDIVIDPQNPNVLYATFLTQGIYKSTDGGASWTKTMAGLPANADYDSPYGLTRFALGISHPTAAVSATLYVGFDWFDTAGGYHPSTVWKSTDDGANWRETRTEVVGGYCGSSAYFTQCWYDNVIEVDPTDPNTVYALGLFDYDNARGGIFRSKDGGGTWIDLGHGLHPDYHAIAIRRDAPQNIVVGNDGGVWASSNYGGRLLDSDPVTSVTWTNLNGTVNSANGSVVARSGLQITQFTSVAQHPTNGDLAYGGAQDNGTSRKDAASKTWTDYTNGDGGQVIVDPVNPNYVYGTYYYVSPFRFDDGMFGPLFSNNGITNGLNRYDRSAFYIPISMDPRYSNRLYLGTYRVYRTDNRGDQWNIISPDLTGGSSYSVVTAFGPTTGAPALYTGSSDGRIYLSVDANQIAPAWVRRDKPPLPERPVTAFAVDRSDYRVAYVAFGGFDAATYPRSGHVFKTTDGGQTWTNINGNLPDVPVNSLVLDPSYPNTLYAGTDVGPMVTTDGGSTWAPLGAGFPIVTIFQLDLNPGTRLLRAATHGRGAWSLSDGVIIPALQIVNSVPTSEVSPGRFLTYTLAIDNIGNAAATGVTITDPVPANTSFVGGSSGASLVGNNVVWSGKTITNGGSISVSYTVQITTSAVITTGSVITNDGYLVTSAQGAGASGSPVTVTVRSSYIPSLTPASYADGTRSGQAIAYTLTLTNASPNEASYDLTTAGSAWPTTFWDGAAPITRVSSLSPGATASFIVRVSVPASASNGAVDVATVSATSTTNPSHGASATINTTAVTNFVLLVDGDGSPGGGHPDVSPYYRAALDSSMLEYNQWNLETNSTLPFNYMKAHKLIVWFTGAAWPRPLQPYESNLAAFLDNGGRLFMSGMDILDQEGGTTSFVRNYLHIDWDGTERQNDTGTIAVTAVSTNTVTGGMGTLPMSYPTGLVDYSNQTTPVAPAVPAFLDDKGIADGLTVAVGNYKVVFLAFPFEAVGTDGNRADLMRRILRYFDLFQTTLPLVFKNYTPQ